MGKEICEQVMKLIPSDMRIYIASGDGNVTMLPAVVKEYAPSGKKSPTSPSKKANKGKESPKHEGAENEAESAPTPTSKKKRGKAKDKEDGVDNEEEENAESDSRPPSPSKGKKKKDKEAKRSKSKEGNEDEFEE